MIHQTILLPRNFAFFSRLPTNFRMQVMGIASTTKEGTWYKVEIQNQKLHVLSKRPLQIGEKLLVKKTAELKLEIIKTLVQDETDATTSVKGKANDIDKSENLSQQQWKFDLQSFPDFLLALSLNMLQESKEFFVSNTSNRQYHFILPIQYSETSHRFEGLFRSKSENSWQLFLAIPEEYQKQIDLLSAEEDLRGILTDLQVETVHFTTSAHITALRKGVDVVQ